MQQADRATKTRQCRHLDCRPKARRGFTLLELLVVVAVVAVLISIMLPFLSNAREASRKAVCLAHLKQTGVGVFAYAIVNDDWAPAVMEPLGTRAPRTLLSRPGRSVNLGLMIDSEVETPNIFFCPSQKQFNFNPNLEYLNQAYIGGSYAYAVNLPAQKGPRLGMLRHLALASDDFTARLGGKNGVGMYSHKIGYNVLYTDGSALWYSDPDKRIARRRIYWDDETDDFDYSSFYQEGEPPPDEDDYGSEAHIFRVWHAFCYRLGVPDFPDDSDDDDDQGDGDDPPTGP